MSKKREEWDALGLCTNCGESRDTENKLCSQCGQKQRGYRMQYEKREADSSRTAA